MLRVRPGLNKDQVRLALGNPHFGEGLFGVTEWDYVFDFHSGQGPEYVSCQFKVKYDRVDGAYQVASTHWKDPACAQYVAAPWPPAVAAAVPMTAAPAHRITRSASGLFVSGDTRENDLLPRNQGADRGARAGRPMREDCDAQAPQAMEETAPLPVPVRRPRFAIVDTDALQLACTIKCLVELQCDGRQFASCGSLVSAMARGVRFDGALVAVHDDGTVSLSHLLEIQSATSVHPVNVMLLAHDSELSRQRTLVDEALRRGMDFVRSPMDPVEFSLRLVRMRSQPQTRR